MGLPHGPQIKTVLMGKLVIMVRGDTLWQPALMYDSTVRGCGEQVRGQACC